MSDKKRRVVFFQTQPEGPSPFFRPAALYGWIPFTPDCDAQRLPDKHVTGGMRESISLLEQFPIFVQDIICTCQAIQS